MLPEKEPNYGVSRLIRKVSLKVVTELQPKVPKNEGRYFYHI